MDLPVEADRRRQTTNPATAPAAATATTQPTQASAPGPLSSVDPVGGAAAAADGGAAGSTAVVGTAEACPDDPCCSVAATSAGSGWVDGGLHPCGAAVTRPL